ncbi:MAG: four helix bundle protein [Planctomycetaceae bacterium]|nr:four helix bundle protein [Planctomycetaceae bacterium]
MFKFEKLDVWQAAIEYADAVYRCTREFPADERFGLTSQVRRAAVSVSSNIAEGGGRGSNRDFIRFTQIAYGSLMESISQLQIARRQGFLKDELYQDVYQLAERVARMLSGLRTSMERTSGNNQP